MKYLRVGLALFLFGGLLFAQDIEPEEPGIVLPPAFLEVEDLQVETVEAAVPDDDILLRPDITIPLPQADDLYLPEEMFDIPYPDQVLSAQQSTSSFIFTSPQNQRSSIFSEGQIGVGSMNHVLGDISLFKLGFTPRFNLRFFHEKVDGYYSGGGFLFHEAGSGYYHSDDILNGAFSYITDGFSIDAEGEIAEASDGLQGRSPYDSLSHRFMSVDVTSDSFPFDILTLTSGVRLHHVNKTLSATAPETPVNNFEFSARPSVSILLDLAKFRAGIETQYEFLDYTGQNNSAHKLKAIIDMSLILPLEYKIALLGGVSWTVGGDLLFPVSLTLNGSIGNGFLFSLAGGYKVEDIRFYPVWKESPLLDSTLPLSDDAGWYGAARAQFRPVRNLLLNLGTDFSMMNSTITSSSTYDAGTGLFAFTQEALTSLEIAFSTSWDISRNFRLETGWTGRFIELPEFTPAHTFDFSFEGQDNLERFGGALVAVMNLDPDTGAEIPELAINGFYRITEGVMFQLDADDLLSPLISAGRPYWDGYKEAGIRIILTTRISL